MPRSLWDQYASVSAHFADDRGNRKHSGIDLNSFTLDEEFSTPFFGPVTRVGSDPVFGNYVIQRIEHMAATLGTQWYAIFAHLNRPATLKHGDWLGPGDVVGHVGMTGEVTGANPWHLHLGIACGYDTISPVNFYAGGATLVDPWPITLAAFDAVPWESPWGPVLINPPADLPVPPLGLMQRRAAIAVHIRTAPNTDSTVLGVFPAGGVLDVEAYAVGELIGDTQVWFYRDGQFFSAAFFEDQSTHDLPERIVWPVEDDPIFKPIPGEPEKPAPTPPIEEDPVTPPTIEIPVRPVLNMEALEQLLAAAKNAPEPENPVIADSVAKPLWITLALTAVSVGPIVALTLIDYGTWNAESGGQLATTVGAWAGAVAAVLGLSRFAKTKG